MNIGIRNNLDPIMLINEFRTTIHQHNCNQYDSYGEDLFFHFYSSQSSMRLISLSIFSRY